MHVVNDLLPNSVPCTQIINSVICGYEIPGQTVSPDCADILDGKTLKALYNLVVTCYGTVYILLFNTHRTTCGQMAPLVGAINRWVVSSCADWNCNQLDLLPARGTFLTRHWPGTV